MSDLLLIAFAALLTGVFIGWVFARPPKETPTRFKPSSVTRLLFLLITCCALVWVFASYGIAIYSTVTLGQVYTMAELAEPAITSLLGAVALKVLENIFEHNDGALFGHTRTDEAEKENDV